MKYAVVKVINGSYSIHAEGFATVEQAKVSYHGLCQVLWNAPDVLTASVAIVDEQMDVVEGYKEFIYHTPTPTPTPDEEPEAEG